MKLIWRADQDVEMNEKQVRPWSRCLKTLLSGVVCLSSSGCYLLYPDLGPDRLMIGGPLPCRLSTTLGELASRMFLPTSLFDLPLFRHVAHVVSTSATEAWCYYYDYCYVHPGRRRRMEYYKFLMVYFDAQGVAIDKSYKESDKVEPRIVPILGN